jgi:hypothetical protein
MKIMKWRKSGQLTELKIWKGFLVELLSGAVWIMVFATSKGKTADQNWKNGGKKFTKWMVVESEMK